MNHAKETRDERAPLIGAREEAEIFRKALERLKIKGVDAPRIFGVARQTLATWANGRTKIPRAAFVILLQIDNTNAARTQERFDQIAETVERLKNQ